MNSSSPFLPSFTRHLHRRKVIMSSFLLAALLSLLAAAGGYVAYWTDYWVPDYYPPNDYYDYYNRHTKYPHYPHDPRDDQPDNFIPPSRGEDAYPGKYLGMGTVNSHFGGRQVELVCTLNSGNDNIVSNVIWTKIKGAYPLYENPPPYECPECSYFPINYDDQRIKAYDYKGKSVLLIQEVHQEDYGVYRCSATAQRSQWGDIETVYQIVKLRSDQNRIPSLF